MNMFDLIMKFHQLKVMQDMDTIWLNCDYYNGRDSEVGGLGNFCRGMWLRLWEKAGFASRPGSQGGATRSRRLTAGQAPSKWEPQHNEPSDSKRSHGGKARSSQPKASAHQNGSVRYVTSAAVLAEISLRSPRKLWIFILKNISLWDLTIQKINYLILKINSLYVTSVSVSPCSLTSWFLITVTWPVMVFVQSIVKPPWIYWFHDANKVLRDESIPQTLHLLLKLFPLNVTNKYSPERWVLWVERECEVNTQGFALSIDTDGIPARWYSWSPTVWPLNIQTIKFVSSALKKDLEQHHAKR